MLNFSTFLSIVWFICGLIVNGNNTIYPTISNSTGDYFISQNNNSFDHNELFCTSDKLCHIECIGVAACRYTIFNCNNASICDITCSKGDAIVANYPWPCTEAIIYTSPIETNIHCNGLWVCDDMLVIYTDYNKYPSSKTTLTCDDSSLYWYWFLYSTACDYISLRNPSTMLDNYGNITYERFKVFCTHCEFRTIINSNRYFDFNTLATPTILNKTGEYYFRTGAHVDFKCTHNELCHIECGHGDCYKSNIDCGNSSICYINCKSEYGCRRLGYVNANDIRQFNLECHDATCDYTHFNLTNIESINIYCSEFACDANQYEISNVDQISVICGKSSCNHYSEQWFLTDINNATFICQDGGCDYMNLMIRNSSHTTVSCVSGPLQYTRGCYYIDIEAIGSEIDISCEYGQSCHDMNICTDERLKIDCIGYNTCSPLNICDNTTTDIDINCEGEYSCNNDTVPIAYPTDSPTTSKPSESPTFRPSLSPIQMIANKQENTTNSPFETWEIIVLSIVIVFIIIMIMYLKVLSDKKVEFQKANWDEVETATYEK